MNLTADDGFFFGLGLFETIAVENGKPIFLNEHLQRLSDGMASLGMNHSDFNIDRTVGIVLDKIKEDRLIKGAVKITLTEKNLLLTTRDNPYKTQDYKTGFSLKTSPILRNESSAFTYVKSLNYGDNILEKRRAHKEGFDEPVFLNSKGEFTEGATSNLFFVRQGKLLTPSVSCGLLNGILRQFVIQHFNVMEGSFFPTDLSGIDEMFITNSLLGIMPVRQFNTHKFDIGPITEKIQKHYREYIQMN